MHRKMTYDGLAQAIADDVNETIRSDSSYDRSATDQMITDKASSNTPSYLDHYDVADKAREFVEYEWCNDA
jgi:hypothetical protein